MDQLLGLTPLETLEKFNPNKSEQNLDQIYVFLLFFFSEKKPYIPIWFQKLTCEFFENDSIKECIEQGLDLTDPNDIFHIIWDIYINICLDKRKLEMFRDKLIPYRYLLYPKFLILDITSEYLKQNPHTKCCILDVKYDYII
jgi:hypothetical protein